MQRSSTIASIDQVAPQPVVPPPPPRRSLNPLWLVLAVLALPVIAALLLAALFVVSGSESSDPPVEIEFSGAVPDADLLTSLTAVGQTGASVELMLRNPQTGLIGPTREVLAGSAELTAFALTPFGRTDLLRWSEESDGRIVECWGSVSDTHSSAACSDPGAPQVSWGVSETSAGTIFEVSVTGLPDDAVWLVTSTWGDGIVASPVVEGVSLQQWPPDLMGDRVIADGRAVAALNSDLEVVFQQSR